MAYKAALSFRTGTAFVIRELTGEKRTVTLKGRGLPKRPFTISGGMRTDLTWYAGSPEGTLQIMGATLDPTTITGKWSDRFISLITDEDEVQALIGTAGIAGQPVRFEEDAQDTAAPITIDGGPGSTVGAVENVREIADIVDLIRRQGQILEVTWGNQLRRGIMTKFVQKWHTSQDLEWEMVFQWMSQDAAFLDEIAVDAGQKLDLDTAINKANDAFEIITAKPFEAPTTGSLSRFGAIKAAAIEADNVFKSVATLITDVQTAIFDVEDTAVQVSRSVVGAVTSAKRVAGAWNFLKQRADDLALMLENVEDAIALNEIGDAGDRLASRKQTRDRRQGARRIVNDSARQQDSALKGINPELVRSFTARANQDLRDISTLHYGTPDGWQALLQYNNLGSSKLEAGQLIFVPRTPPQVEC